MNIISSWAFYHKVVVKIKYYVILIVLILSTQAIQAQIIYTDINDTILTFPQGTTGVLDDSTNYFYFDLDRDGTVDFYFYAHFWEEWVSPSAPEYPQYVMQLNSLASNGIPWSNGCAVDFGYADTIWSNVWESWGLLYINIIAYAESCNLPFVDRYIGLRLTEGADHYYGWIRLDAKSDTLRFKDFAVNTVPNQKIFAGQTSSIGIIGTSVAANTEIHYDGSRIYFKSGNFNLYEIYNIQGKLVLKGSVNEGDHINLNNFQPGIYILDVNIDNRKVRHKLLVE